MKALVLILALILVTVPGFTAEDDIIITEVRPDVTTYKLDTVKFLVFTQTCSVTYRKIDADGNSVGEETTITFRNIKDDPETPNIDETDNSFSLLIQAINNGSNIKTTITNAVKIKLGL